MQRLRVLVTAGGTRERIDSDHYIINKSTGEAGEKIARYMKGKGYDVTVLTADRDFCSHDDQLKFQENLPPHRVKFFTTYNDFLLEMVKEIGLGQDAMSDGKVAGSQPYGVVIHTAAVSDYSVAGVYRDVGAAYLQKVDNSTKIDPSFKQIYLELCATKKPIDKILKNLGFKGLIIKIKPGSEITNEELYNMITNAGGV